MTGNHSRRSLIGGFIWVIPTTFAMAPSAAMILDDNEITARLAGVWFWRWNSVPSQCVRIFFTEMLEQDNT